MDQVLSDHCTTLPTLMFWVASQLDHNEMALGLLFEDKSVDAMPFYMGLKNTYILVNGLSFIYVCKYIHMYVYISTQGTVYGNEKK